MWPSGVFLLWEWGLRRGGVSGGSGLGRLVWRLKTGLDDGEDPCDLRSPGAALGGVAIEQRERLGEDAQMLLAPGTRQRHRDVVRRLLPAGMA